MPRFRASTVSIAILSILILSTFCLAQQAPVLVTKPVDNAVRTVLTHSVHPLARAEFDRGEVPAGMPLHRMLLVLKRSDQQEAALRRLIENQQYENSPYYHQWLTPQEFGAQFGPAQSDMTAVVNWLTASGFEVTQISNGRTMIEFNGTAGQVRQAFGTALHKYVVNGEEHLANSKNLSIPTALAPIVAGVNSLHDFRKKAQNDFVGTFSRNMKTGQVAPVNPQFTFPSQCFPSGQNCEAVGPLDFATIYDVLSLWNAATPIDGTGQTIGIVGRTNVNPNDAPTFWSLFGLNVPANKLNIILNGPDPGINGDEGEADIDIQWSGAVAPGAIIDFVTSESTETTDGVDLSALYIVDNNIAPVMSESYGSCEAGGAGVFYGPLWEQAAAQGISAMVSTGDNSAAGCDNPNTAPAAQFGENVNALASTPWNAAIGGTDFNQYNKWSTYWNTSNGSGFENAKGYIPETTWNDTCTNPIMATFGLGNTAEAACNNQTAINDGFLNIVGGSGGFSGSGLAQGTGLGWLKPTWQTGTGINDNARDLPDVSLFASNGFMGSFYIVCQSDTSQSGTCDLNSPYGDFAGYGGTSVASPAFAGIMALVNQKYGPQGVPGLVLYNLASKQANAFHDVPAGTTIAVACYTGSTSDCTTKTGGDAYGVLNGWATTTGYDLATGLGSVDAANLVNNWNKVTFTPTSTTFTLNGGNPVNIVHGANVNVSASVTPSAATGDVALLIAPGTPGNPGIDFWPLTNGSTSNWVTNLLPGGTYNVIAHYEGDHIYGGSYSTSPGISVTVSPETSSVYMGNPPGVVVGGGVYANSVVYGTGAGYSYWLRADVYNSQGLPCTNPSGGEIACPTGTISFTDNGNSLDSSPYKLNTQGYTEDQAIQLTGGSHTIIATYSSDASYQTSSTTATVTVTAAPTTFTSVTAPGSATANQNFTVTAMLAASSSEGVAPTGTITFKANGTALPGTVTYTPTNGNPTVGTTASLGASLTTSISATGTYTITATYSGDTNYASQASSPSAQIVIGSPQNVGLPPSLTDPATANPGQKTITTMQVSTSDGQVFASNPSFSCSGLPTGATCSFSPASLQGMTSPQTVTITVQTTGPFTGTAGGAIHGMGRVAPRRAHNQNPRLWLPLSLPMAGVMLVGLAGRRIPRRYQIVGLCLTLLLAGFLVACGGGSSAPVVVNVSPGSVNTLFPSNLGAGEPSQTQQFSATVTGTSNTAVTWTISSGGTTDSISSSGLYTAPNAVPAGPVTITATSQADMTKTGNATVTIQTPTPPFGPGSITVTATEGSQPSQTTSFNLTVVD